MGVVGGALAGLGAGVLVSAHTGRVWLVENREAAVRWIEQEFMAFDPTVKPKATAAAAYASLLNALDPGQPAFRVWLGSWIGAYALFVAWCVLRATPHRRVQRALRPWLGVLVALAVITPPLAAASRSHPAEPMAAVAPNSPATVFLRDRLAPVGVTEGARPLERVYAGQAVYLGRTDVEPNALLPLGVQEAGGYSSLSSERHMAYAWASETSAGRMLDAWNARYYVAPNVPQALPSVELASYHPERPLLTGNATNAGATAWFRVPAVLSENVRVVATLRDAWGANLGTVAAWVAAEDDVGQRYVWPLRVGLEIAEATSGEPAMRAERPSELAESPIEPLMVHTGREFAGDGSTYAVQLYYAKLALPRHARIVRIEVQAVALPSAPHAILRVHGLGAGQPDWEVHNVVWHDRERFTALFSDDEVRVYRNETALPRAYLVPLAVALPEAEHVKQMAERAFDPERMVLIDAGRVGSTAGEGGLGAPAEGFGSDSWYAPPAEALEQAAPGVEAMDTAGCVARSAAGVATITRYSGTAVTVQASVVGTQGAWLFLADTYDRAWRAYVDGRPARVQLANAMFRAVPVPPGEHVIELRYESTVLERGAAVSVATGLAVLVSAVVGVLGAVARRRCVQR